MSNQLSNYVNGQWSPSAASEFLDVTNPARSEMLAQTPLSGEAETAAAMEAAAAAFQLSKTEIFGPVLSLVHAETIDEAIDIVARNPYGNAASIFTTSGAAARKFRYEAPADNIGVNIGVAAPMAYFPFSGWKDSFLGVLHGQGHDAVEFYTDKKVVVELWPKEWSRKF